MRSAIVLHGRPDKEQWEDPEFPSTSNYYWLPWLQKQLAINGVPTETPEVPDAWRPHYPTWLETFERYSVTPDTILVGHSCGAGFLIRWLSEHPDVMTNKVYLVSPWIDPAGDPGNEDTIDFMKFDLDSSFVSRTKGTTIFGSSNDLPTIQTSVATLREKVKDIKYVELENRGHFYDESALEFPELLEDILI